MKKKTILLCCALLCMTLLCACKSEEQIAQTAQPQSTVISPDVHITQEASERETLTVSGEGEVKLTPDLATVSIVIKTTQKQAEDAQQKNAELTDAVLASLKVNGVQEADIQTEDIHLGEEYNYDKSPAELVGYSMRNTLSITVREIETVGKVITDAIAAGATSTYGLAFTVSDSSGAYQDALTAAVVEARGKANAMAAALCVELAPIPVSVNEVSASYQPYVYEETVREPSAADMAASNDANGISVSTGELSVTAKVNVVYEVIASTSLNSGS